MSKIKEEAVRVAQKIGAVCQAEKVILFGSTVRDQATNESDIDLLVIKNSPLKRPFRAREIFASLRNLKRVYPLDVVVYTPQEIKTRLTLGDYFIKRIFNEGQILYG